jgi:hypothetical protein
LRKEAAAATLFLACRADIAENTKGFLLIRPVGFVPEKAESLSTTIRDEAIILFVFKG